MKEETLIHPQKNEIDELESRVLECYMKIKNSKSSLRNKLADLLTSSASKCKTLTKELAGLKKHSTEMCQHINDLENEVKDKDKTVKVKDAACFKFKKEKEDMEHKLNEALEDLKKSPEFFSAELNVINVI